MNTNYSSLELSVVLPAYREALALELLLPALKAAVAQLTASHEILVVDAQHSLDQTREVCFRNGVSHLFRRHGDFYGDAVRTGIEAARGEYILFMDADGSHNPAHIASLWTHRRDFDVVIGSRYMQGGMTENPAILVFMSWIVNAMFRTFCQVPCHDMTNSFRLYHGDRLRAVTLVSKNFDILEELLIKLYSGTPRARLKEVPVVFERRKAGESKRRLLAFAATYLWTLGRLLRIRFTARGNGR